MNAQLPLAAPPGPAPVKRALDATWSVLSARLRNLRRFAVGALAWGLLVPIAALIFRSGWGLAGWAALPLLGMEYFRRERGLVDRWENFLLDLWAGEGMYLSVVVTTLQLQPGPLKTSLNDMLALLPVEAKGEAVSPAEKSLRRALAASRQAMEGRRALRGLLLYLLLISLVAAAMMAARFSPRAGLAAAVTGAVSASASWGALAAVQRRHWRARLRLINREKPWEQSAMAAALASAANAGLPRALRGDLASWT